MTPPICRPVPRHELLAPSAARLPLGRRLALSDWAERYSVVTTGEQRFRGPYRKATFPLMAAATDIADRPRIREVSATGPTRGGKTRTFLVVPTLRDIQEGRECLLVNHTGELAETLLAEIEDELWASPELRWLAEGVRGETDERRYPSGAVLHCCGAGSIGQLAGFNAERVRLTEVDKYKTAFGDDAGPVAQAIARSDAYKSSRQIVYDSSCSTAEGFIWRAVTTAPGAYRPLVNCPHCGEPQMLLADTDDGFQPADPRAPCAVVGRGGVRWADDSNPDTAARSAFYACPFCSAVVSLAQWEAWSLSAYWQPVDAAAAELATHVSFRWNSLYVPWTSLAHEVRDDLWAARARRPGTVQKAINLRLALPYRSPNVETVELAEAAVAAKVNGLERRTLPADVGLVTGAVDVKSDRLDWVIIAWTAAGAGYIIDYGETPVARPAGNLGRQATEADKQAEALAIFAALQQLGAELERLAAALGRDINLVLVDAGWAISRPAVYRWCRARKGWCAAKGFGDEGVRFGDKAGKDEQVGDNWKITAVINGTRTILGNADYWKAWVHQAFRVKTGEAGSLSFWGDDPAAHLKFAAEVVAEQFEKEWVEEKGFVSAWVKKSKHNHKLDCCAMARCAADTQKTAVLPADPKPATTAAAATPPPRPPERRERPQRDGFAAG